MTTTRRFVGISFTFVSVFLVSFVASSGRAISVQIVMATLSAAFCGLAVYLLTGGLTRRR